VAEQAACAQCKQPLLPHTRTAIHPATPLAPQRMHRLLCEAARVWLGGGQLRRGGCAGARTHCGQHTSCPAGRSRRLQCCRSDETRSRSLTSMAPLPGHCPSRGRRAPHRCRRPTSRALRQAGCRSTRCDLTAGHLIAMSTCACHACSPHSPSPRSPGRFKHAGAQPRTLSLHLATLLPVYVSTRAIHIP